MKKSLVLGVSSSGKSKDIIKALQWANDNNMNIGNSLYDEEGSKIVKKLMEKAKKNNVNIILPTDFVCGDKFSNDAKIEKAELEKGIPDGYMGLDIGEKSLKLISEIILKSHSVLWNGPLGAFEYTPFDKSTIEVANMLKKYSNELNINTLAGGGDTLSAINKAKAKDAFNYLSNAGGAFLEWLEGNKSPGFIALKENRL